MTVSQPTTTVETLSTLHLSDHARDALQEVLVGLPNPTPEPDLAMARLFQAFARLSDEELRELMDVGRHIDAPGVCLVQNLPVDPELPPTPEDGGPSRDKPTHVSENVLLGLSGLLGEPTGVVTEKAGQLVHDVIPVAAGARSQTNQSSASFLNFHNDIIFDASGSYTANNPDFLVLLCLRSDPERVATTFYADARDVCRALDEDSLSVLRQPLFQLNAPGSYCRDVGQERVLSGPTPVISGPTTTPEISSSANGVFGVTKQAQDAVDRLQETCREVAHQVTLLPGQSLIINNRKGVHARSQFEARHDGTDRWLQRSYVRRDLWSLRYRLSGEDRRVLR